MISKIKLVVILVLTVTIFCQAAQFTVFNETGTTIFVRPEFHDYKRPLHQLGPGESIDYDSVFYPVISLYWEEHILHDEVTYIKKYEATFDVSALAIGGDIRIQPDGHYKFKWATFGGEGEGVATTK